MLASLRYILLPVLNVMSPVLTAFSLVMLLVYGVSLGFDDGAADSFLCGAAISLAAAALLMVVSSRDRRELVARDGFLLATLIWVTIPLLACIPIYLEVPGIPFLHAYFEAMSGATTTCATVISGLDTLPVSINVWRCLLSWLGGMGILVLAVAILPMLGVGGAQIFKAEASGPMKDNKLTPRIADTAKGLWWVYLALTVACAIAYKVAGMSTLDAILHTFTTVSLGGFSSHDASFGYWDSEAIEFVAMVFMTVCGASFSLHFMAWRRRSILPYLGDPELRGWLCSIVFCISCVTWILVNTDTYPDWHTALRHASFNALSILSTTGFSGTDYGIWPAAAPMMMVSFACFASCGGSTGGGVKMMRAIILVKQTLHELTHVLHPQAVRPLQVGAQVVSGSLVFTVLAYMLLWGAVVVVSTLAMLVTGLDPVTAFSAILACVTNVGPGLANVGPAFTFGHLSDFQLSLCTLCMLAGRLELMTVFVLFTRNFWRV